MLYSVAIINDPGGKNNPAKYDVGGVAGCERIDETAEDCGPGIKRRQSRGDDIEKDPTLRPHPVVKKDTMTGVIW